MQVASRFTKSEAQLKAEQLKQTSVIHEPQDDPLLQRAKEVLAENWEAPPSRDKVQEAMAILRTQRSVRSSASKTSSIQTSLRAQSLKSRRTSDVDVSEIIANDELNALHQTRSPVSRTSSTISGIGLNREILSPTNSHISIQHNESLDSPANDPRKPSRTNASASSHLSPMSTSTPMSTPKKSFFANVFASRADGNELLPSSIVVPPSDGDGYQENDARDEAETMRSSTPVFSNTTSRGAKDSPNDEHLVTEIDAYYGCQSSDNELPDVEPKVTSPVARSIARAVNFTGIQRQDHPPPSPLTMLAPALEAFFDKIFFPGSGGSNNRFSITSRLEDSKHENKENDSHIEPDVPTAPDVSAASCGDDIDMTEIDAYYQRESLSSSDLKYEEQNPANSDSTVEEESSDGDQSIENSAVGESEMDDYCGHGSVDSDAQSLELLKDMMFDRIAQKDSYGKVEERMLNAEMHIALTITPNSSTISGGVPATTNGSYDQSYSSGMSTEVEDAVQNHDDPVIRSFSDRESSDEDRPSPRNGSRVQTPSSGTSTKVDDPAQRHDDAVIRSFSDGSDEERSSPRNGSSIRSQSTGTFTEVDDVARVHDDPVIRSFSDKGSSDEDGEAPSKGNSMSSQSTGTFTDVDDTVQVHEDPVIQTFSDRGPSGKDGQALASDDSTCSPPSVMPVEVEGIVEQHDDIAEDASLDPVIQSFSDMQSIDEDDNILSYLERIEASKSANSEFEFVEVVRISPSVTVPGSPGEQAAEPTASLPPLSDDDGVDKDAIDFETPRRFSLTEADAIVDGAHKTHSDITGNSPCQPTLQEVDAIASCFDDTPRHVAASQADYLNGVDANDTVALRGEGYVAQSGSSRGIALDAEQKAFKESIDKAMEASSRTRDFPPSSLPLDSDSSSGSDSLIDTELVPDNVGCGAIAAASACFNGTKDVGCKVAQTFSSPPDLSTFLPRRSDINAMVGACAADSMCLSRTPKSKGGGNFRLTPIQLGSNSKMLANRKIFNKTPATDAMTSRQAAFEEIGAMVMKILKDNDVASVTTPTDCEVVVEPVVEPVVPPVVEQVVEQVVEPASIAVPTDNLLDLDAVVGPTDIADPFPLIDFGEFTPANLQMVNSTDFWDTVKESLAVPNDKTSTIETTKLVKPPKVEDLLGADLKVGVDTKKGAISTTGIPISIEIPEEDRQISAINSICSGAAEPNGKSSKTLQNQITAGLKEIFMNKVDTTASPRTNSKYDAYFEDVGKFVNSLLNGTSMYFDDAALRSVEDAIQNNIRDAMSEDNGSKHSDTLSVAAPASLTSKDASVDDAEFVNAFIKGF